MAEPFEKTMEIINGVAKPGLQFFESSDDEFTQLNAKGLRSRVEHFDDLATAAIEKDRMIALLEFGLTPQLLYAFDCVPLILETFPMLFTALQKDVFHTFLAEAEEAGAPSDVCSTDRLILGAALRGEFPIENAFFVTGSSPCDGTRLVYPIMQKILEIPTLYIESPYTSGREAARWYGSQLKTELIPFLEKVTGKQFDLDRFREVVEESNRAYELMLDIYECYKMSPCPHPVDLRRVPYGLFISQAGHPRITKSIQVLHDDITRRIKERIVRPGEEKCRVMWAHVPPTFDNSIFTWMENELGASVIMDSLSSTATLLPIDTTDLDSMLEGYAWQGLDMTMSLMRKDTRELWECTMRTFEDYSCDALIVTIHVGCNNIAGCAGLWRRYSREKGIPLLLIEFDYNDDRVLSSESIREQLEEFFTTII